MNAQDEAFRRALVRPDEAPKPGLTVWILACAFLGMALCAVVTAGVGLGDPAAEIEWRE
jgi:hypothetical protein